MKNKRFVAAAAALTAVSLLIGSTSAIAAVTSFGKWASRTKTLYVSSSSAYSSAFSSGAAKWRNSTNFSVTTAAGTSTSYSASDVSNPSVDWDGICTYTLSNGYITKAVIHLNTFYTSASKYTSSVLAGLAAHEIGHSLGLNHAPVVETSSIMQQYTFKSDGTLSRALNPSASDKAVVNGLYPLTAGSVEKKSLSADGPLAGAAGAADGVYLHPSWAVYYEDEEALAEAADLVVRGYVLEEKGTRYRAKSDYSSYTTQVSFKIAEVWKGEAKLEGGQIVVAQMGGTDGTVNVLSEDTTRLKKNEEAVLFLRLADDGTYRPINENDGLYMLSKGKYLNAGSGKELQQDRIR